MMVMNLKDIAILNILGAHYWCIINYELAIVKSQGLLLVRKIINILFVTWMIITKVNYLV